MPTISVENYLKAIYHLEIRTQSRVKTSAIAEALELSLPSVTSMLKSLSDEGLVDYERYKGARLTDSGRRAALKVIRKHRLIELFLVTTLDYTWDEVHVEAERLEHAISDELAARIEQFLSFPTVDPHGDPIPTADGQVPASRAVPLDEVPEGHHVALERVVDQDPEVLRYLERLGLTPRAELHVEEVIAIDGQMYVRRPGDPHKVALSRELARRLRVLLLHPSEER